MLPAHKRLEPGDLTVVELEDRLIVDAQAVGKLDQEAVSSRVPEAVVHDLEAIQVDEQHRQLVSESVATGKRMIDAVEEEGAIGQAGQRVVERALAKLLLELLALDGPPKRAGGVLVELARTTCIERAKSTRVEDATEEADHRLVAAVVEGEPQARAVRRDDCPVTLPIGGRGPLEDGA